MKPIPAYVIIAVFAVIMVFGSIYVYNNEDGSYEASAEINGDGTVTYSLSGPDSVFTYSVFANTKLPEKLFLYCDDSYKSDLNDRYTQREFLTVLQQLLERRGMASEFADADDLVDIMGHSDYAVFFVSGALPDTVYDGKADGDSLFVRWLSEGGTVYWTGPEMGRYVSTQNSIIDYGTGFFDGDVLISDENYEFAHIESDMFRYTQIRYDDCKYGLRADRADSQPLSYISDGGYSSVSVAKVLGGNVTVFGGNLATTNIVFQVLLDRTCCADMLICGLTYESQGLDHGEGTVKGSLSASTDVDVSSASGRMFLIIVGNPASNWSKAMDLSGE